MSILKSLGIEEYTSKFKEWIENKLKQKVSKDDIKTINGESIIKELNNDNITIMSDWNANKNESGYIENRTHWYYKSVEEIELHEDHIDIISWSPEEDPDMYDNEHIKMWNDYGLWVNPDGYYEWYKHSFDVDISEYANLPSYIKLKGLTENISVDEKLSLSDIVEVTNQEPCHLYVTRWIEQNSEGAWLYVTVECAQSIPDLTLLVDFSELKQLDDVYMPDTVVRKNDLQKELSNVDNENEKKFEKKIHAPFIKNDTGIKRNLADDSMSSGNYAICFGRNSNVKGDDSYAEGLGTVTNNSCEHAQGKYNKSNSSTIHSVGIGIDGSPKNAHVITSAGKHYIYNIGGYDGTNPNEYNDVATVLPNMVTIHHNVLVNLRNNSKLVPGQQYRIAGYQDTDGFDIIVTADSESTLNENARATWREGDVTFKNCDLNAWELKYCLDNDTSRFEYANLSTCGVIYYMKDEWNNECPYDFKTIKINGNFTFGRYTDESRTGNCFNNVIKEYTEAGRLKMPTNIFGSNCYNNYIGYNSRGNVFSSSCHDNVLGNDCYSNNIGSSCTYNTFGNSSNTNTLGNYCTYNVFGNYFTNNTLSTYCRYNTFGNYCRHNNMASTYTYYCRFGDGCSYIKLYTDMGSSSSNLLTNVIICGGVKGNNIETKDVNIETLGSQYEIKVANNTDGDLKIYCETDLIT